MGRDARKAKPTAADIAAAKRIKGAWLAIPKDRRQTQDDLAAAWGDGGTQSLISQYLGGRIPLNVRAVPFFASQFKKSPRELYPELPGLESMPDSRIEQALMLFGQPITLEAANVGREWAKLEEPLRTHVAQMIDMLVAAQVRAGRRQVARKAPKDEARP